MGIRRIAAKAHIRQERMTRAARDAVARGRKLCAEGQRAQSRADKLNAVPIKHATAR